MCLCVDIYPTPKEATAVESAQTRVAQRVVNVCILMCVYACVWVWV